MFNWRAYVIWKLLSYESPGPGVFDSCGRAARRGDALRQRAAEVGVEQRNPRITEKRSRLNV